MNSFGRIFAYIFWENHGESVGIVIDGVPAGLPLTADDLLPDLEKKKGGNKKELHHARKQIILSSKSGIFNNKATGAPITIFSKTTTHAAATMKSNAAFHVPAMQILLPTRSMAAMKTFAVEVISAQRLTTGLVAAGPLPKK